VRDRAFDTRGEGDREISECIEVFYSASHPGSLVSPPNEE
jgi:hypothetical protein